MQIETREKTGVEWMKELAPSLYTTRERTRGGKKQTLYTPLDWEMDIDEMEKVLSIIREEDLILYPSPGKERSHVSFSVYQVNQPDKGGESEIETLLFFTEDQLAQGYDFSKLSPVFLSKRNFELMKSCDMDTSKVRGDRNYYTAV